MAGPDDLAQYAVKTGASGATVQPGQMPPDLAQYAIQPLRSRPSTPPPPGFGTRLAQSLGIPTSAEELQSTLEHLSGAGALYGYGSNLYQRGKEFVQHPSVETGANAVVALTPGGALQKSAALDIANKNYAGAAGTAVGVGAQFVAPELAERGADFVSTPKGQAVTAGLKALTKSGVKRIPYVGEVGSDVVQAMREAYKEANAPKKPASTAAAPTPAQAQPAPSPQGVAEGFQPGKITPQGWYYLGRLQEIAKQIEAEQGPATPKNVSPSRAANLKEPVTPSASSDDLTALLEESRQRAVAAKGKLSEMANPQPPDIAANVTKVLERQPGLTVGLERLLQAPELKGVSLAQLKTVAKQMRDSGKVWGDYVGSTDNIVGLASRSR